MTELISYFIVSNVLLSVLAFTYSNGLRNSQDYKSGRPLLLLGLLLCLFLPFINVQDFFESTASSSEFIYRFNEILVSSEQTTSVSSIGWSQIIQMVYGLGIIVMLVKLYRSILEIQKIKRKAVLKSGYYELKNSTQAFSFFNSIYLGDQFGNEERNLLLKHEQIHLNSFHSIDLLFCKLLEMVFWFNPMVYRFKFYLEELHEFEADEKCNLEKSFYVNLMLNQHFEVNQLNLIHQFNSNHLKNRIMRINNKLNQSLKLSTLLLSGLLFSISFLGSQYLVAQTKVVQEKAQGEHSNEVDKTAEFPGGQKALMEFLGKEIKYPKVAKDENSEGTVFTSFVIGKDGVCRDFKIKKGVSDALDEAALDALKKMPKWKPAEKDGKRTAMEMTIPVKFQLPPPPPPPPAAPKAPEAPAGQ